MLLCRGRTKTDLHGRRTSGTQPHCSWCACTVGTPNVVACKPQTTGPVPSRSARCRHIAAMAHLSSTLESVVNPKMVLWLASHGNELNKASRDRVANFLCNALATHAPASFQYAVEVARVHVLVAHEHRAGNLQPFVAEPHVAIQAFAPPFAEAEAAVAAIAAGSNLAMPTRLHVYNLTVATYEAAHHVIESVPQADQTLLQRTRRLVQMFSKECTFKMHGDACVHHEIVTCLLSPWVSGCTAVHETPYSLMNFAFGEHVNDVLRPVIDASTRSKLGDRAWVVNKCSASSLIHAIHVLAELIGNKRFRVLSNANICRGDGRAMFVYRTRAGEHTCGVFANATYHHIGTQTSLANTVFALLTVANRLGCVDSACVLSAISEPTQNGHFERYMAQAL